MERGVLGTPEFNSFAAGAKVYGANRLNPTSGAVDKTGYADRDRKRKVKLNALQAKVKAGVQGKYANSQYGRFI